MKRWLWQWRRIDGCQGKADRLQPAPGVTEIAWRHCSAGTRVEHVRLDGQAHGWPGGPRTAAATGTVRRDVADLGVLPQPPAAAARRVSAYSAPRCGWPAAALTSTPCARAHATTGRQPVRSLPLAAVQASPSSA